MILRLIFLSLLLYPSLTIAHEFNYGHFEIYKEDSKYYLQVKLDSDNLLSAVAQTKMLSDTNLGPDEMECYFTEYIQDHMGMAIEGVPTEFTYDSFETTEGFTTILIKIETDKTSINKIDITNTILLDQIENHYNIISLKLHNKSRSFRLTKERTSTTITY